MTVIALSNSEDSQFGLCGNELSGRGGDPRLYMTRGQFNYGPLQPAVTVGMASGVACVAAYTHDGVRTAHAYINGAEVGKISGLPAVQNFGAGGHLAMPFWANNSPHKGDLAEVLVHRQACFYGWHRLSSLCQHSLERLCHQIDHPKIRR